MAMFIRYLLKTRELLFVYRAPRYHATFPGFKNLENLKPQPCFSIVCLAWFAYLLSTNPAHAQPVLTSKRTLHGQVVYQDLKQKNIWYYAPGNLRLAQEKDGKPQFQLVEMRYTGMAAAGTQGEKRFLNLVQVVIWMDQPEGAALKTVQQELGGPRINLKPLPVRNIEAFLIMPMGASDGRYRRVGSSSGLEGADSKTGGYWTERAFTVRLENHEAQMLWDQVSTGKLAMSLGYAFYADVVASADGSYKVSGDSSMTAELKTLLDEAVQLDSTPSMQAFHAGAFPIEVDVKRWPDLLRKVDINDEAPPAWAMLEVKCYDFADNLRPDLAMKTIEIEASGVSDEVVKITGKRFMSAKPDQHTLQIRFPYAVKLTKPYRYRVTEYSTEGSSSPQPWTWRNNWAEVLDITTPADVNRLESHEIDVETDPDSLQAKAADELVVTFTFTQKDKPKRMSVRWQNGDWTPIKTVRFFADKDRPLQYHYKWKSGDQWHYSAERKVGTDKYVYVTLGE